MRAHTRIHTHAYSYTKINQIEVSGATVTFESLGPSQPVGQTALPQAGSLHIQPNTPVCPSLSSINTSSISPIVCCPSLLRCGPVLQLSTQQMLNQPMLNG